jgi:predicted alpha/beta-hydrolase family hydrolase
MRFPASPAPRRRIDAITGESGTIIVAGRSNRARASDTFLRIAEQLRAGGYSVVWFESARTAASRRIDGAIEARWPALAAPEPDKLPLHRRAMRFAVKSALALASADRRDFVGAAILSRPVMAARELGRFLDTMPAGRVHLLTHSAGGVAATMLAAHPRIDRIVCFGYPFRHPDRPPERYRTAHLAAVRRPLLVLQGTADEYGADPDRFGAFLPAGAQIVTLDCNHDYSALPQAEFDKAWSAVSGFLG